MWKSRDDAHVQSSSKTNPPDVVQCSSNISATTIDGLFLTPNKIFIPERYVPEDSPELSPKELMKRKNKVENIKKMLSQTSTVGMVSKKYILVFINISSSEFHPKKITSFYYV